MKAIIYSAGTSSPMYDGAIDEFSYKKRSGSGALEFVCDDIDLTGFGITETGIIVVSINNRDYPFAVVFNSIDIRYVTKDGPNVLQVTMTFEMRETE